MSPAEAERLLAMAGNLKVHAMLALGYGCGLRSGERRQHDVAVLAALRLHNTNDHLLAVDVASPEPNDAWREVNRGHISLEQLKVMSAIERCRTAALGGHVARCENEGCAYTVISYNSCRDRHCPKCQAAASRVWLAEREAELLPVEDIPIAFA